MHRMSVGRLVCAQSTLSPTGIETAGRHMACLLYTYLYIRKYIISMFITIGFEGHGQKTTNLVTTHHNMSMQAPPAFQQGPHTVTTFTRDHAT